jgi:hypothetical protein
MDSITRVGERHGADPPNVEMHAVGREQIQRFLHRHLRGAVLKENAVRTPRCVFMDLRFRRSVFAVSH